MPAHKHFQQTRQLNLWGFQRLTLIGKNKQWFHPHFIRGSVDGLKRIERVEVRTSDTSKRGPPPELRSIFDATELKQVAAARRVTTHDQIQRVETSDTSKSPPLEQRQTFDSRELKQVETARRVTTPNSEPALVQALDQHPPKATVLNSNAMLVQALQKYQQLTQKIARIRDTIRLIDESKQKAAQPVSPASCQLGSLIGTVEQRWQPAVPMPSFLRPPEHEIRELEQQQKAKVTVFQHTLPPSVYPSPVTFVDNSPIQENQPYHSSFSSSPSSQQFKVNSTYPHAHLSNFGHGAIIHGGRVQPPTNDEIDDDFQLLVSQIFKPPEDDGDSYSVLLSNELEEEFMNPINF